ncbi:MAG: hypothetical protein ACOX7P_05295 [Oscillospiraceae bacterium]|jgi:hypothetical protein
MLVKLLKHEFRSTGRIMWPLYLVLLALSFFTNLSVRQLEDAESKILNILGGIVIAAFSVALVAVCVMSVVLMVYRFRTNLMNAEGYLMFTLPVSVHQLIWSKIIVSVVWFAVSALAVILSGMIAVFRVEYISDFLSLINLLFVQMTAYYAINGAALLAEALVFLFFICAAVCLHFYASIAVGHSFTSHKRLLSVAFFFVFMFAVQLIISVVAAGLDGLNVSWNLKPVAAVYAAMGLGIVCALVYGAAFYAITAFTLKKRLNLE